MITAKDSKIQKQNKNLKKSKDRKLAHKFCRN